MMNSVLKALGLILGGAISLQAVGQHDSGSAYERLRVQFYQSHTPTLKTLMMGKVWHCSGSLEAAKGQFRQVQYWEARYQFLKPTKLGPFVNRLEMNENWYQSTDQDIRGIAYLSKKMHVYEFIRKTDMGDLIIELATLRKWQPELTQSHQAEKSLSEKGLVAHQYLFCENPQRHENRNWGQEPFEEGAKKRAQSQGSF